MGFINCSRDCAYENFGSCTLDNLKDAQIASGDDECIYYLKRVIKNNDLENKKK